MDNVGRLDDLTIKVASITEFCCIFSTGVDCGEDFCPEVSGSRGELLSGG